MTFTANTNGLFFRQHKMGDQDGIVDLGMAFYATYILKMKCLVWQPVMGLNDIDAFPVGQQLKLVKIRVAGEAYCIIISNGGGQVISIPDADMIGMGMAFPATEFFGIGKMVDALPVFFVYLLELILGVGFIICMAIQTLPGLFQPDIQGMGEFGIISRMAIIA
jgi:hypothetical protein